MGVVKPNKIATGDKAGFFEYLKKKRIKCSRSTYIIRLSFDYACDSNSVQGVDEIPRVLLLLEKKQASSSQFILHI